MGKTFSYGTLFKAIDDAAARLASVVNAGDVVTICMPNTPECVYCFYAVNRLGAGGAHGAPARPARAVA